MTITPDEAFTLLANATNELNSKVSLRLQAQAEELEAAGWPLVRTADFRAVAGFFREYLIDYYSVLEDTIETLQDAQAEDALESVSFARTSELP